MTILNPSATWTIAELDDTRVHLALKALEWALSAASHHAPRLEVRDGNAYCPRCDEFVFRSSQIGALVMSQEMYGGDVDGALRDVADRLANTYDSLILPDDAGTIHDLNGNRVGSWEVAK